MAAAGSRCLCSFILVFLVSAAVAAAAGGGNLGYKFGLDLHHRFSDTVRRWAESRSHQLPGGWPEKGSVEYYSALAGNDRRRLLLSSAYKSAAGKERRLEEVTFMDGNATVRLSNLGFLHYALVALGTPNVTFLVALDTGSDLFWVPCDCVSCASPESGKNGFDFDFSIYSPNTSSTSKPVLCNSQFCSAKENCSGERGQCPYNVEYVSADTSSRGSLVQDFLYMTTEDASPKIVKAPIVFGCGQVQTGSFLDGAATNGLFGLGMDKVSVPSILSSSGITSNSFSMCFGRDGIGRISFGDNGSSDQEETPFHVKQPHPIYNISLTGISVGKSSVDVGFSALVDSGTSFTYLADPAYTSLTTSFNAQVQDKRYPPDDDIPFENCFHISSNETLLKLPDINFTTESGSQFPITDPIIIINHARPREFYYCLAVVKSSQLNIIGQNFLTNLRLVFDRERMILGWKKFNCYDVEKSNPLPVNPRNRSASPPSVAFGPKSYSPEATKENNGSGGSVLTPSDASRRSLTISLARTIITLFLLPLAILS